MKVLDKDKPNYLKLLLIFLVGIVLLGVILYLLAPWFFSLFFVPNEPDASSQSEWESKLSHGLNNLENYGVSNQEAIKLVKQVESKQVKSFLAAAQQTEFETSGEAIDLAARHFELSGVDLDRLKRKVNANLEVDNLNLWVAKVNPDSVVVSLGTSVVKKQAVQLLEKKSEN